MMHVSIVFLCGLQSKSVRFLHCHSPYHNGDDDDDDDDDDNQ